MKKPITEEVEDPAAVFLRDVGQRIKLVRETHGMSRREMTEKANLKPAYGLLIEMEGQNFTIKSLNNIAKALGCDARDLMPLPSNQRDNWDPTSGNDTLRELIEKQQKQIAELAQVSQRINESMSDQPTGDSAKKPKPKHKTPD